MVLELQKPRPIWQIMFSTHHTDVGLLYLITSLAFMFMGGALALLLRVELFSPGVQIIADSMTYNRIFTVHGTTLIFLFILPSASAFGNYLVPIMVRFKDMAYPKLNAVAFWMIPPAGALIWLGFADFTWYAYPTYSVVSAPGPAADMWIFGLKILGVSSILGSINFVVTIMKCKHPDLPLSKMPLLAWAYLTSSLITLVAVPTFAAALLMLLTDRLGASGFFNPAMGGDPIAYQHLFWFTFHPEVYILVIPAIGFMYEIFPRFSRKPIFSHGSGVAAFTLLTIVGFADFTWYAYPTYSVVSAPGPAADMWIFGLKILGVSSILGSINFVVTIKKCKHPDLPLSKMPLLAWAYLTSSLITLVAVPTFAAALLMLLTDRLGASGFFNPAMGGDPIAYQHLFWFTFPPEVYILVIPAIGFMYEIFPRFSRKPIFSHSSGVAAFTLLTIVGFASWAHHMYATGMSFTEKTVFMVGTLAAVPASAMHTFNFLATMWGGRI